MNHRSTIIFVCILFALTVLAAPSLARIQEASETAEESSTQAEEAESPPPPPRPSTAPT